MTRAARTVICTLGMHRSGTSLVSRILNLLGVHLGSAQAVSGVGDDNPKGFWEHHPLALLNDEILIRFGGRWDVPPVFPPGWTDDAGLIEIRQKAQQILTEEFALNELWGWKDPRTCLTAPFWQDLVGPMRYVLCVRNPRDVAASLHRRDHMLAAHADRLWLIYVAASLTHTNARPRLLINYEDLMADWPREVRRLAAFIGRPDRADEPLVSTSVADFIAHELRHHRSTPDDLAADQQMSFETRSLYLALRAHADAFEGTRHLDLLAAQAVEAANRLDAFHLAHAGVLAERDRLAAAVTTLTRERDELAARPGRAAADPQAS